jgi:hypothetical protein
MCRCYEGQRAGAWGRQGPSHTGLSIIQTIVIHRFRRRSRKPLWGRAAETEEPEWKWEWRAWTWGGGGCVWYSAEVRYTIDVWYSRTTQRDVVQFFLWIHILRILDPFRNGKNSVCRLPDVKVWWMSVHSSQYSTWRTSSWKPPE